MMRAPFVVRLVGAALALTLPVACGSSSGPVSAPVASLPASASASPSAPPLPACAFGSPAGPAAPRRPRRRHLLHVPASADTWRGGHQRQRDVHRFSSRNAARSLWVTPPRPVQHRRQRDDVQPSLA